MAAGAPVISTNTGGLPEINKQGFSGMLSNVGDIEDMAKNASFILSDNARHEEFSKNARTQAAKFDIDKILPLYEGLYNRVINK
jgi:glycosyltransferase involved in cell wall biosynthesis